MRSENILDLLTDTRHEWMDASDGDLPSGERDVDGAGGWTPGIDRGAPVAESPTRCPLLSVLTSRPNSRRASAGTVARLLRSAVTEPFRRPRKSSLSVLEIAIGGDGGEPRAKIRAQRFYVGAVDGFRHSQGREARPWPAPLPGRTLRTG